MVADILATILEHKRTVELPARRARVPLAALRAQAEQAPAPRDWVGALRAGEHVALIAEIKCASPSKGVFAPQPFDPLHWARVYDANGAAAISVLTDEAFFKGAPAHLQDVRRVTERPLLRKDFVIDAYQVYEARAWGADAVLLIVAALDEVQLADLHALAQSLGLAPLVEVHDPHEVERALRVGARVIGVNNRDLRTFRTDLATTARCAAALRGVSGITLVSESGIFTAEDVARVATFGAHAVLVGEALITAADPAAQVRALARVRRVG